MRGYFGIGIYHPKKTSNIGTLWRSAQNFGASFMFTVGRRYEKQASDTTKAWKHMPLFEYESVEDFINAIPKDCLLTGIEQVESSRDIRGAAHDERAVYILGAEDHGLPDEVLHRCHRVVSIDTPMCLNVAVAGSIVMYDRQAKTNKK